MTNSIKLLFLISILVLSCTKEKELFISSNNPQIEYWGRVDATDPEATALYWSGTSIKMNFEGESIQGLFMDETGDNYYNIIIDNDSTFVLRLDKKKQYYQLASNLAKGKHSIEVFKRTEWNRGKSDFYGFRLNSKAVILPQSEPKRRKIEFYGNSITAGYAVEDTSGRDSPDSTFTNHYVSYAAITARHYDAEFQSICKSGIGITISWFPITMPELYDRLDPENNSSRWDFSLFTPDIVVINLFQNDAWLLNMPEHEQFKANFGSEAPKDTFIINAYQKFVAKLRQHYPEAAIICALGNMDATQEGAVWPAYVEKAVANLKDQNIYTHFIPFKGTSGHPSIQEQKALANSLIRFIDENIAW